MSHHWLVWAKDQDDFALWSGNQTAHFVVARGDGPAEITAGPIVPIVGVRLLVVNGGMAADAPQVSSVPAGFADWLSGARVWVHIGGFDGPAQEHHWTGIFSRLARDCHWPLLAEIAPQQRQSFGSTHNAKLRDIIAPALRHALDSDASPSAVFDALEQAWSAVHAVDSAEQQLAALQHLFPVYLILCHPDAASAGPALQAAAKDAQAATEADAQALDLLGQLAQAPTPPDAPLRFLQHFRLAAAALGVQLEAAGVLQRPERA
jgi:hypothetical protein